MADENSNQNSSSQSADQTPDGNAQQSAAVESPSAWNFGTGAE